jgi:hypothetical protein
MELNKSSAEQEAHIALPVMSGFELPVGIEKLCPVLL